MAQDSAALALRACIMLLCAEGNDNKVLAAGQGIPSQMVARLDFRRRPSRAYDSLSACSRIARRRSNRRVIRLLVEKVRDVVAPCIKQPLMAMVLRIDEKNQIPGTRSHASCCRSPLASLNCAQPTTTSVMDRSGQALVRVAHTTRHSSRHASLYKTKPADHPGASLHRQRQAEALRMVEVCR